VLSFAPAAQIDPVLSGKSYYLEPAPNGTRAYILFREALRSSGQVAVAKVALRNRESLAAIRVSGNGDVLVLETLLWPDEVRVPDFAFLAEDTEVRSQELAAASALIATMSGDFSPSQYKDGYREALESVVRAKIDGGDVVTQPGAQALEPGTGAPADLGELLRASVDAAKARKTAA
jgi:DNA end-binding protein Ku